MSDETNGTNGTNGTENMDCEKINGTNGTAAEPHEPEVHFKANGGAAEEIIDTDPEEEEAVEAEADGPTVSEELGRVVVKPEEVNALELDFQHCRIPRIENLETLTKIENLGFRSVGKIWQIFKNMF